MRRLPLAANAASAQFPSQPFSPPWKLVFSCFLSRNDFFSGHFSDVSFINLIAFFFLVFFMFYFYFYRRQNKILYSTTYFHT